MSLLVMRAVLAPHALPRAAEAGGGGGEAALVAMPSIVAGDVRPNTPRTSRLAAPRPSLPLTPWGPVRLQDDTLLETIALEDEGPPLPALTELEQLAGPPQAERPSTPRPSTLRTPRRCALSASPPCRAASPAP